MRSTRITVIIYKIHCASSLIGDAKPSLPPFPPTVLPSPTALDGISPTSSPAFLIVLYQNGPSPPSLPLPCDPVTCERIVTSPEADPDTVKLPPVPPVPPSLVEAAPPPPPPVAETVRIDPTVNVDPVQRYLL